MTTHENHLSNHVGEISSSLNQINILFRHVTNNNNINRQTFGFLFPHTFTSLHSTIHVRPSVRLPPIRTLFLNRITSLVRSQYRSAQYHFNKHYLSKTSRQTHVPHD